MAEEAKEKKDNWQNLDSAIAIAEVSPPHPLLSSSSPDNLRRRQIVVELLPDNGRCYATFSSYETLGCAVAVLLFSSAESKFLECRAAQLTSRGHGFGSYQTLGRHSWRRL